MSLGAYPGGSIGTERARWALASARLDMTPTKSITDRTEPQLRPTRDRTDDLTIAALVSPFLMVLLDAALGLGFVVARWSTA